MLFNIYISSHTDAPDFEGEIHAKNREEAIEKFYEALRGEFDKDFIDEHIEQDLEEAEAMQADVYDAIAGGN